MADDWVASIKKVLENKFPEITDLEIISVQKRTDCHHCSSARFCVHGTTSDHSHHFHVCLGKDCSLIRYQKDEKDAKICPFCRRGLKTADP